MIERSAKLLKQAYPINSEGKIPWAIALSFGLFVGLFLWLLQPFGLASLGIPNKTLYIGGYGAITALLMIINVILLRGSLPGFYREKNWTVGKEIIWVSWNIFTIALANWYYSIYWINFSWNTGSLLFFVFVTLGVGIFPIVLLVLLNANRLLKKHLTEAQRMQSQLSQSGPKLETTPAPIPIQELLLSGENQKENLRLSPASLLFIRSADNYVEIHFETEGGIQKRMLRSSLARMAQQIEGISHLMRCHRAYIVNLLAVQNFKGDSQGYKLYFEATELVIPVSRRYTKAFRETYQGLNQA
ncbi:MAG: LytTR family DNA-binding domain-containing protein [Bacteroidota bacterium]